MDLGQLLKLMSVRLAEGSIERSNDGYRLEICPDNERDFAILLGLIKQHLKPGIAIFTDCWKGHLALSVHEYIHSTVNHSENFVNPETGAHPKY